MNEELTNEALEAMTKCNLDCTLCGANAVCAKYDWQDTIQTLATSLLAEMDKPKHDVWKNAPEWATSAMVRWSNPNYPVGKDELYSETYTRELPKTRARIMAEEIAAAQISNKSDLIDIIEQTIKTHIAELKKENE